MISWALFSLHAYLIFTFVDIPAMALIMRMKVLGLVEHAISRVFVSILTLTMSLCDKTRFLELHLLDTSLLVFPCELMR